MEHQPGTESSNSKAYVVYRTSVTLGMLGADVFTGSCNPKIDVRGWCFTGSFCGAKSRKAESVRNSSIVVKMWDPTSWTIVLGTTKATFSPRGLFIWFLQVVFKWVGQ